MANRERQVVASSGPAAWLQYRLLKAAFALLPGGRGRRKVTRLVSGIFPAGNTVTLAHEDGFDFTFTLDDPYWSPLLSRSHQYEPDLGKVLLKLAPHVARFVDCGANKGFWTARAADLFAEVIAIEASPTTFSALRINGAKPNVKLLNSAVHDRDGETVKLVKNDICHGAAFVASDPAKWKSRAPSDYIEEVPTTTLDTACPPGPATLVKLDVEGAEIAAFRGAWRLIEDGAVFIFEDHRDDPRSAVSRFVFSELGLRVFDLARDLAEIGSAEEVSALKATGRRKFDLLGVRPGAPILSDLGCG